MMKPQLLLAAFGAFTLSCGGGGGGSDDPDCEGGKCEEVGERSCIGPQCDKPLEEQEFEYVIVGSGAGGGTLAASLARKGHSVLLLEAGEDMKKTGDDFDRLMYEIPVWHALSTEHPPMQWDYFVEHFDDNEREKFLDTKRACERGDGELVLCDVQSDGQCECPAGTSSKGIFYPRSGTLGGCTAHNAMISVAAKDSDWNGIADVLAGESSSESWRASNMRQYFDRVMGPDGWLQFQRADTVAQFAGFQGEFDTLSVDDVADDLRYLGPILHAAVARDTGIGGLFSLLNPIKLINYFKNLNQLLRRDINEIIHRDNGDGPHLFPLATRDRKRRGTREYLMETIEQPDPVTKKPRNLTIKTKAFVTQVLFEGQDADGRWIANGVEFIDGPHAYGADPNANLAANAGQRRRIQPKGVREVILSAGAFNTPQLLMLSGIGPTDELAKHKITQRVNSPGVGKNLQDRYEVAVISRLFHRDAVNPINLLQQCDFSGRKDDACLQQWEQGKGPYHSNGGLVSVLRRSDDSVTDPDLHIFAVPGFFKGYYPGYSGDALDGNHQADVTWLILKGHTGNRAGSVTLASDNPRQRPVINFRNYAEGGDADLKAIENGIDFVRDVMDSANTLTRTVSLGGRSMVEQWPGRDIETGTQEMADWIKGESWGHHASCTAQMGPTWPSLGEPTKAVLDGDFRVQGTKGLRVVDASVFPRIPGTFIVLPIYMMSEKAADVISAAAQ